MGRKLGMSVFGVDYILTEDGTPYIVDVNDFLSFKNIPEAISLISDYIYNMLQAQNVVFKVPIKIRS